MQNIRNNSISKAILAIITVFVITTILAEPTLLTVCRATAQVPNGGSIEAASYNPPVNAIRLDPPQLTIVADLGAGVPDNTVQVAPPGKWLATTITPWLEIHCATGNCGSFFIVRFLSSGLKPGNYNGEVKVAAGNDSVILPVSLKISMTGIGDTISTSIGRPTDTPGTPNYPINSNPKIVAFGDSITYGYPLVAQQSYPNLLQKKIAADGFNFEVVNAGVNGETSAGGLQRIDSVLDAMGENGQSVRSVAQGLG